jgi:DNA-binding MarR family transcriptional regulator
VLGDHRQFTASSQVRQTVNPTVNDRVSAFRRFNRFYTQKVGILKEGYLGSSLPLAKVRVLYEIAHREKTTASELSKVLALDPGYLSRIIRDCSRNNVIRRSRSKADGRENLLELTNDGRKAFKSLNNRAQDEVRTLLNSIGVADQNRLIGAMHTIEDMLGSREMKKTPYLLRPPRPGDMGWVVHRHGAIYSQEYGWDERFEALVARIVADFMEHFDAKRERCWIAERDAEIVGSVFLVKKSATVAQLRLLLVEPNARGLGIGTRLVEECTSFARAAGYRKITLWTNSVLHAARHTYRKSGYRLVRKESHQSWGHSLVSETWELQL